jgi:hypothetical protein
MNAQIIPGPVVIPVQTVTIRVEAPPAELVRTSGRRQP